VKSWLYVWIGSNGDRGRSCLPKILKVSLAVSHYLVSGTYIFRFIACWFWGLNSEGVAVLE
jgi:hypothetical protein